MDDANTAVFRNLLFHCHFKSTTSWQSSTVEKRFRAISHSLVRIATGTKAQTSPGVILSPVNSSAYSILGRTTGQSIFNSMVLVSSEEPLSAERRFKCSR